MSVSHDMGPAGAWGHRNRSPGSAPICLLHTRFSAHAVLCTRGSLHMRFSVHAVLCTCGSLHMRFSVHAVLCTHGYCLPSPASHSSSLSAWSLCQQRFPSFFFLIQPRLVRVFSVIRGKCFRICLPMQET